MKRIMYNNSSLDSPFRKAGTAWQKDILAAIGGMEGAH